MRSPEEVESRGKVYINIDDERKHMQNCVDNIPHKSRSIHSEASRVYRVEEMPSKYKVMSSIIAQRSTLEVQAHTLDLLLPWKCGDVLCSIDDYLPFEFRIIREETLK